jgi:hypothetical protein
MNARRFHLVHEAAALSEIRRRMGAGNTLAAKTEERLGA